MRILKNALVAVAFVLVFALTLIVFKTYDPKAPEATLGILDMSKLTEVEEIVNPALTWENEALIKDFEAFKDEAGTYKTAGEALASMVGVTLNYDFKDILEYCTIDSSSEAMTYTAAAVCSSNPKMIYINSDLPKFQEDFIRSESFMDTIRHELAHLYIVKACGTVTPEITGNNNERVTNSYAVKYYGSSLERIAANGTEAYQPTPESDAIAAKLREKVCS